MPSKTNMRSRWVPAELYASFGEKWDSRVLASQGRTTPYSNAGGLFGLLLT
jgi:hypothetical protein